MTRLLIICVALLGLSACQQEDHSSHNHATHKHEETKQINEDKDSSAAKYICPMHPHIEGKEGDTCPICNMYLTPQEINEEPVMDHSKHSMNNSKATSSLAANISSKRIQNVNVKTTAVLFGEIKQEYIAFAKVVSQNKAAEVISMRDNGWVEEIANFEQFDRVKKGDFLFEFYSQEIKSAQIDYILALKQNSKSQIKSAKARLTNLGVQEKAITELKKEKQVTHTTKFYSPIDGYIKELNINKGQNLKPGEIAMLIQPTEQLWVNAYIAKDKLGLVKNSKIEVVGKPAVLSLQNVLPELDEVSQSYIVRLKLKQSNLQNGDFIDVKFTGKSKDGLIIPKSAILNDSGHSYVFVQNNKAFNAVMVKTAEYDKQSIIITSGLNKDDKVVTNSQFLIDSEAKLQSSFSSMANHKH
jgi:Cu(I)/Ag(I) efflux system membrane fusion protein